MDGCASKGRSTKFGVQINALTERLSVKLH